MTFVAGSTSTARRVLERLVAGVDGWAATSIEEIDHSSALVGVAWYQDHFHRVEAFALQRQDMWLVRHHEPPKVSYPLHDWLKDLGFRDIRWQTKVQWGLMDLGNPRPGDV